MENIAVGHERRGFEGDLTHKKKNPRILGL